MVLTNLWIIIKLNAMNNELDAEMMQKQCMWAHDENANENKK